MTVAITFLNGFINLKTLTLKHFLAMCLTHVFFFTLYQDKRNTLADLGQGLQSESILFDNAAVFKALFITILTI